MASVPLARNSDGTVISVIWALSGKSLNVSLFSVFIDKDIKVPLLVCDDVLEPLIDRG